ncbi:hypothetical protein B0A49_08466 [Cryomyces minteri]|uniref:Uncharacterized protein n=1 Tax=Cryomyces minteri TaxID=331657 RepID=A0A4U0WL97_9PEZI|nr:hypothetical protein B0A49_08466 [Cryomyces minteri]
MPMVWNAQADAKLFAAVLKVHDLKLDKEALAQEMGPDCTAYAIAHRIKKIKTDASATADGVPAPPPASTMETKRPASTKKLAMSTKGTKASTAGTVSSNGKKRTASAQIKTAPVDPCDPAADDTDVAQQFAQVSEDEGTIAHLLNRKRVKLEE